MLIRISFFAALGGFLFGYDLGLIGSALLGIQEDLDIRSSLTQETIVGALKFGAFFGTFLGGALMLRYGRRPAIATTAITGVLGPVIMAVSGGAVGLVIGRVLCGLGIGISAIVVPAYLAELAPAQHRGAMVQIYEVMLCIGTLLSTVVDWAFLRVPEGWRYMVGVPAIPGAVIGLALLILPESPRWLVMQGRLEEALHTLQGILRGSRDLGTYLGLGRVHVPQSQLLAQSEDELLHLWSSVEKDMALVMSRREAVAEARRNKERARALQQARADGGKEPLLESLPSSSAALAVTAEAGVAVGPGGPLNAGGGSQQGPHVWAQPAAGSTSQAMPTQSSAYVSLTEVVAQRHRDTLGHTPLLSQQQAHPQSDMETHAPSDTGGPHAGGAWGVPGSSSTDRQHKGDATGPSRLFTLGSDLDSPGFQQGPASSVGGGVWGSSGGGHTSVLATGGPPATSQPSPVRADTGAAPGGHQPGSGAVTSSQPFISRTYTAEEDQPLQLSQLPQLPVSHDPLGQQDSGSASPFAPQPHRQQPPGAPPPAPPPPPSAPPPGTSGSQDGIAGAGAATQSLTPVAASASAFSEPQSQQPGYSDSAVATGEDMNGHSYSNGRDSGSGSGVVAPGKEGTFWSTLYHMMKDIKAVLKGDEKRACAVACWLAIFNQATASTAIINYAPTLFTRLGSLTAGGAASYTIAIAMTKVIGVGIGMVTVDVVGRRPLLIGGSACCAIAMAVGTFAAAAGSAAALLMCVCVFVLAFSISWAGVYWVVVSEVFSMSVKSPASSAATSLLFLSGAVTNMVFLVLVDIMGPWAFLVFSLIAVASGVFVWASLPETKGRTLAEVQELMTHPPVDWRMVLRRRA